MKLTSTIEVGTQTWICRCLAQGWSRKARLCSLYLYENLLNNGVKRGIGHAKKKTSSAAQCGIESSLLLAINNRATALPGAAFGLYVRGVDSRRLWHTPSARVSKFLNGSSWATRSLSPAASQSHSKHCPRQWRQWEREYFIGRMADAALHAQSCLHAI